MDFLEVAHTSLKLEVWYGFKFNMAQIDPHRERYCGV